MQRFTSIEQANRATRGQAGLTLPETITAIIVGLVVLSVLALAPYGLEQYRIGKVEGDLSTLHDKLAQQFSSETTCTGLDTKTAIAIGALDDLETSSTTATTPWGGAVTVACDTTTPTFVDITIANPLPQGACTSLSTYNNGAYQTVTTNTTSIPQTPGGGATVAAAGACLSSGANTIVWVASIK